MEFTIPFGEPRDANGLCCGTRLLGSTRHQLSCVGLFRPSASWLLCLLPYITTLPLLVCNKFIFLSPLCMTSRDPFGARATLSL